MESLNNIRRLLYISVVLLVSLVPTTANCQILDWIVDTVVDEFVGNTVSSMWNSYLDSEAKNAVNRKASRLADWPLDDYAIAEPDQKYNMTRAKASYTGNYPFLSEKTNSLINSVNNVAFSNLAKGKMNGSTKHYMDSLQSVSDISSLESVVSMAVKDSMNTYGVNHQMLLNDIKSDKRLALLLNSRPELVRIYHNAQNSKLKSDCLSLLYWGVNANEFDSFFSPKTKFIKGKQVTFTEQGKEVTLT